MKTFFEKFTAALPANGQPITINKTGSFVSFRETDFPVELNIPGVTNGWEVAETGVEYHMDGEETFTTFMLRTPAGSPATTVQGSVGRGRIIDNRFNVVPTRTGQYIIFQEARTVAFGNSYSIASGSYEAFALGAATATRGRRKSIIITNADAASPVYVKVEDETTPGTWNESASVYPQRLVQLNTDAAVRVHNPSGGSLAVKVLEIFYAA